MVALTVRLVVSLAVVVGLLLLTARLGSRRFRSSTSAPVRVVHRQSLSRSSSIAVIEVGSRTLLIGTTEHQINLLTDLTDDLPPATQDAAPVTLEAVRDEEDAAATGSFGPHLAAALASRGVRRPRPVLVTDTTDATGATHDGEATAPEGAGTAVALDVPVALEVTARTTPVASTSPVSPASRPAGAHRRTSPSTPRTRTGRAASPESAPAGGTRTASGPLAGSVLSADTWRQAVSVARGRAR